MTSKENLESSSSAFCTKNKERDFVFSETWRIKDGTMLKVEAVAMRMGLEYYISHNRLLVIMEIDSLILKKISDGI